MSLRERLGRENVSEVDRRLLLFNRFGVADNPFPAAGQTTGHPRLENQADEQVAAAVRQFERDDHATQVLVVEGTQGVGKTNLLNYYQEQLEDLFREDKSFYIIRYYPDPEPSFDNIVRRVFQEFGASHLVALGRRLADADNVQRDQILEMARNADVRILMRSLIDAAGNPDSLASIAGTGLEWLLGFRLLKRHREELGVFFRLDTVEAKTQALRDVVVLSDNVGLLKGIFLLLDELEKQAGALSKGLVLRYLFAIRALIDALPRNMFMMLAITPDARARYAEMLPSLQGRIQNTVRLSPIASAEEAQQLAEFYFRQAEAKAAKLATREGWSSTGPHRHLLQSLDISKIVQSASQQASARGVRGILQRDFLNALHEETERLFSSR